MRSSISISQLARWAITLAILATLAVSLLLGGWSGDRRVGFGTEEVKNGLRLFTVDPGLPAAAAGLREGDILQRVDGMPIRTLADYERVAGTFDRGRPVAVEALRDGETLSLQMVPGTDWPWVEFGVSALLALLCLSLARVVAVRWEDLRARLLWWLLIAAALALAAPVQIIGSPWVSTLTLGVLVVSDALEIAVTLHLAAVIPRPQGWLRRRPWLVWAFYGVATCALLSGLSLLVFGPDARPAGLGWSLVELDTQLLTWLDPLWAIAMLVMLGLAFGRERTELGRTQTTLILLALLLRVVSLLLWAPLSLVGLGMSADLFWLDAALNLVFALAVFVAIFHRGAFDIHRIVRRGLLYGMLAGSVSLVFYAALGVGGLLLSQWIGDGPASVWPIAVGSLLVGLLFTPLHRALAGVVDRRVFPERQALRQELLTLAQDLPAEGGPMRMARHLEARLRELLQLERLQLWLSDGEAERLRPVFREGAEAGEGPTVESRALDVEDPALRRLHQVGRPYPAKKLAALGPELPDPLETQPGDLWVPLLSRGRWAGLLLLGGRPGAPWSREERQLLDHFAHHVATVFENIRLFRSATYERLTGLLRREPALDLLSREVERARRYARPLSIALADLDHFKEINDRHGHLVGDTVLQAVAATLREALRRTDAVARFGGEEFLLVLPETRLRDAAATAEDLRRRVADLRPLGTVDLEVRVSIGLAQLRPEHLGSRDPVGALLATADQALYEAKRRGRDQVIWDDAPVGEVPARRVSQAPRPSPEELEEASTG